MSWRYRVWGATHEAISKPSSEAQNSCTDEDMGHFSAGPINKPALSSTSSLTRVREGDGRHSGHFSLLKKCSHLQCLRCLEQLNF